MAVKAKLIQSVPSHASCKMAMAVAAAALVNRIAIEPMECRLTADELELLRKVKKLGDARTITKTAKRASAKKVGTRSSARTQARKK